MEAGGEIKRAKQTQEVKKGKMNGDILKNIFLGNHKINEKYNRNSVALFYYDFIPMISILLISDR